MSRLQPRSFLFLLVFFLLCSGCQSEETKSARSLLIQAQTMQADEQYEEAIQLLDSLQTSYPKAVEERRQALALSRTLRLHISTRDSALIVPRIAELMADLERRHTDYVRVMIPDMPDETLMRYKGYDPSKSIGAPFLDVYIQSDGQIEMVGGYTDSRTRDIVGLRVIASDGTYAVSDTIAYDRGRNYRYQDGRQTHHRLTLSLQAAERIGAFVASSSSAPVLKVAFLTPDCTTVSTFTLTPQARHAIAETYAFYTTYVEVKNLEERLSKHEARKNLYRSRHPQHPRSVDITRI